MFETIVKAAENFMDQQLGIPAKLSEDQTDMRTVIAYIDIDSAASQTHRVYIACNDAMIAMIAELFLGEEDSDQDTLNDMALETTNMIVGSAKVLAEELSDQAFTIRTPHYVKHDSFDMECDQSVKLSSDDRHIMIGIKEQ